MACFSPSNILFSDAVQKITRNNLHQAHLINHCQPRVQVIPQVACHSTGHQPKITVWNSPSLMGMGHSTTFPLFKPDWHCRRTRWIEKARQLYRFSQRHTKHPTLHRPGNLTMAQTELHHHWFHHLGSALHHLRCIQALQMVHPQTSPTSWHCTQPSHPQRTTGGPEIKARNCRIQTRSLEQAPQHHSHQGSTWKHQLVRIHSCFSNWTNSFIKTIWHFFSKARKNS